MVLNFQKAEFLDSCFDVKTIKLPTMPEIVFVGRSNVGKSSMINALLGRKALARTSSTPGKTVSINFYGIDGKVLLTDLPGYGYAKVSKSLSKVTLNGQRSKGKAGAVLSKVIFRSKRVTSALSVC